ncbi:hypothetical protein BT67DRAFT_263066 [Trichocladium antarcticum]|uniref:Uncharacterized protein n=1 Tax=Trichocladium antarcticum TaxID=1450529 RepID=A0AAN6UN79_9PEZI|nr:hypothetical protein BT67DRAFT_263066 [Trichocladium antarcticum]
MRWMHPRGYVFGVALQVDCRPRALPSRDGVSSSFGPVGVLFELRMPDRQAGNAVTPSATVDDPPPGVRVPRPRLQYPACLALSDISSYSEIARASTAVCSIGKLKGIGQCRSAARRAPRLYICTWHFRVPRSRGRPTAPRNPSNCVTAIPGRRLGGGGLLLQRPCRIAAIAVPHRRWERKGEVQDHTTATFASLDPTYTSPSHADIQRSPRQGTNEPIAVSVVLPHRPRSW